MLPEPWNEATYIKTTPNPLKINILTSVDDITCHGVAFQGKFPSLSLNKDWMPLFSSFMAIPYLNLYYPFLAHKRQNKSAKAMQMVYKIVTTVDCRPKILRTLHHCEDDFIGSLVSWCSATWAHYPK